VSLPELRRRVSAALEQAFVPREIFFRSADRFHHFRLSSGFQKTAAIAAVGAVGWVLFTSGAAVMQSFQIGAKERQIEEHRLAYFDLLSEFSDYQTQLAQITRDLEENQSYLLSLLEQNPANEQVLKAAQERLKSSATQHARALVAREGLRAKMEQFETDLRQIADRNQSMKSQVAAMRATLESSRAERDQVAAAREKVLQSLSEAERQLAEAAETEQRLGTTIAGLRQELATRQSEKEALQLDRTALQETIADLETQLGAAQARSGDLETRVGELDDLLSYEAERYRRLLGQRNFLERRVAGLEGRLVDLQAAQKGVIERLSEQARLSVDVVERTVEMTGLAVEALVAEADREAARDQGGPFVPAEDMAAHFTPGLQIAASVTRLDAELNRWAALQQVVSALPLLPPLDQYRITSGYGSRKDPVNNRKAQHFAVDFAAPMRAPVYATAPGKVVFAGWRGRYGRLVEIDHGFGIRTRYAHMNKILVEVGQVIGHREKIGLVGSSGRSTGPHVHYEVRYKGKVQNPMKFLEAGRYVFKG
jgi:murein DD-endopeptidase MepM/ murein hydrolase activator NlpD